MSVQTKPSTAHVRLDPASPIRANTDYQVCVSQQPADPAWDAFLAKTPGGHHVQTSLWAQVKTALGWRVVRVIVTQTEQIVAGAQLLLRSAPLVGTIGYLPKGPLFALNDPVLTELVFNELQKLAKQNRIHYLVIQPPNNGNAYVAQLPQWKFQQAPIEVLPTATIWLDLTQDLDAILAAMKPKTRYNIRLGQRSGLTVREGTEADLHAYYRLLTATSQRQHFSTFSEAYFHEMWRVFRPHGYIKLFLAEFEHEIVSAQIAIPFGNTVLNKLSVWSGQYGNRRPNELLQWASIMWAKAQGYEYYDFEALNRKLPRPSCARSHCPTHCNKQ